MSPSPPAGAVVRGDDVRQQLQPLVDVLRRVPYTASVLAVMVVAGVSTGALWRPFAESSWWDRTAYGLTALDAGQWWTPVTGSFFAELPSHYVTVGGGFALMAGFCEWRLGTRTAVLATAAGQLVGVLGACGLLAVLRVTGWSWAADTARQLDVGFTPGAITALLVVGMTLRAPWHARVVVGTVGFCVVTAVWVGLFSDVANLVAAAAGLAVGRPGPVSLLTRGRRLSRHEMRVAATALVVLVAFAQALGMVYPWSGPLGPETRVMARPLLILFVIAQLLVAAGLHRGSRLAWSAATTLSGAGLLTSLTLRPAARGVAAAVTFLPLLVLLVRTRRAYTAPVAPLSPTRVVRDLAATASSFVAYVVLGFLLIDDFAPRPAPLDAAHEVAARLFFTTTDAFQPTSRPAAAFLASLSVVPIAVLFGVLLVLLIRSRKPAAVLDRDRLVQLLHTYGGGNLSWMATWPDNAHVLTSDGQAAVAYQVKSNTAIALGDPVGAPARTGAAIREYARFCELHGWLPCVFSATAAVLPHVHALGWRHVRVAEDTVIDLPSLQFRGKAWQDVRTALNRAAASDVSFRLVRLREESFAMIQQARGISDEWVSDKGMPEMGFTVGGIDEALDPHVVVGLAVDAHGVLQGITSWLPVYAPGGVVRGWTLDVMRRRPGGFRHVMEFMIASACLAFREQGALTVSLSGAPLARSDRPEGAGPPGAVEALLDQLGEILEPVYGFRSLHQFKTKFRPRHEPMYLCYPDEAALPRIGVALVQAFLPGVGLRRYAAMLAQRG